MSTRFGMSRIGSGVNGGVICMIAAMFLLPVGDTISKLLTGEMHAVEVTLWRFTAQAVFLAGIAGCLRHRLEGPMFSPVVALSGGLVMITLMALIGSLAVMPIATVIGIFFIEPLILTLLARPVLGEQVGVRRLTAVVIGLVGALVVIRPGFSVHGIATLMPLVAAIAYALNMLVLRFAGRTRSGLTIQCGASIYGTVGTAAVAFALHRAGLLEVRPAAHPGWVWGALVCAGALAAASFLLITEAARRAEASLIAPFQYLEILGATVMGYLVFGDFPDLLTWIGIAIILCAGLYVLRRERKLEAAEP